VANNPLSFVDPTGLLLEDAICDPDVEDCPPDGGGGGDDPGSSDPNGPVLVPGTTITVTAPPLDPIGLGTSSLDPTLPTTNPFSNGGLGVINGGGQKNKKTNLLSTTCSNPAPNGQVQLNASYQTSNSNYPIVTVVIPLGLPVLGGQCIGSADAQCFRDPGQGYPSCGATYCAPPYVQFQPDYRGFWVPKGNVSAVRQQHTCPVIVPRGPAQ
jgi:hypothetical protein